MLRKITHLLVVATVTAGALVAAGCTSTGKPYGLTGNNNAPTATERARWTDTRGFYHPEWRNGINTPAGYPRGGEVADVR